MLENIEIINANSNAENASSNLKNLENVAAKDYNTLEEKCNGDNCCLASVNGMRKRGASLLKPGESCPDGTSKDMLKCKSSYQFCY